MKTVNFIACRKYNKISIKDTNPTKLAIPSPTLHPEKKPKKQLDNQRIVSTFTFNKVE